MVAKRLLRCKIVWPRLGGTMAWSAVYAAHRRSMRVCGAGMERSMFKGPQGSPQKTEFKCDSVSLDRRNERRRNPSTLGGGRCQESWFIAHSALPAAPRAEKEN